MKSLAWSFWATWLLQVGVISGAYFGAAKLGLMLAIAGTNASPVWPPTGLALAAVLLFGYRIWPGITIGAFSANVVTFLANGFPVATSLPVSCSIAAGNTLEALLGAFLIHRFIGVRDPLDRAQDVFKFVLLAALLATTVSASIGVISVCLGGMGEWSRFEFLWWTWWEGDAAGALLLTPFLLVWIKNWRVDWRPRQWVEAVCILALVAAGSLVALRLPIGTGAGPAYFLEYMTIPLIIWAVFRLGKHGATASILGVAAVTVYLTAKGAGPFVLDSPHKSLLLLQLYLSVIAVTALSLTGVLAERKQGEEELELYSGHLEELVKERTAELERANTQLSEEIVQHKQTEEALFRAREVAEEANRAKSDFLANMSHELRTPLNAVIGFSELLADQLCGPLNEKQQGFIENTLTSGQHLLSLIDDILDLAKVESGKMELELGHFPLQGILDSSLALLREKALKHNIKLSLELEPEADVEIEVDQRKCKQMLFNLLSNALKFTPDGGSVAVQARKVSATEAQTGGDWVEISVADTGIGIKPEDMPKLFKEFSQLESPYTKQYEGTGLGLALTRKFVKLHGGRIWAESEFGKGSRFTFSLPLRSPVGKTG